MNHDKKHIATQIFCYSKVWELQFIMAEMPPQNMYVII